MPRDAQMVEILGIIANKLCDVEKKVEYLEGEIANSQPYHDHLKDWERVTMTDSGKIKVCSCGGKCHA